MAESVNGSSQPFNIRDYFQIVFKRKWYLIMPSIIVPLVAVLATYFMTPTYEASTSILMKEASVLPSIVQRELESAPTFHRQTNAEVENMLASQIKSTKYIRSLIAKLDISIPDEVRHMVEDKVGAIEDADITELTENLLVGSLRRKINVSVSGLNVIDISVNSSSPMMAKRMTQTLAEIFLEESLAQELAGIQGNISFTEEQLSLYRDRLYNAQNQLKNFRQQVISTSVDEDTTALSYNLNSIFSAVEALDIEINTAEERKSQLRINLMPHSVDLSNIVLPARVNNLRQNLLSTVPQLAELLGRYSWRDAKVVSLNQEAKAISDSLKNAITQYVSNQYDNLSGYARSDLADFIMLDINIDYMRNRSAAMSRGIGKMKSRLTRDPDIEVTLDRLQSEVDRYRELYNLFVQHSQYAAIDQSAKKIEAESKYMIVRPAEMPLAPISPSRIKMLILGIILGAMLGIGIILLIVILDDSYKKVEDVEHELNLPVLATIPRLMTPYQQKRKERGLIYAGTAISLLLIAAIIFMKFKSG